MSVDSQGTPAHTTYPAAPDGPATMTSPWETEAQHWEALEAS